MNAATAFKSISLGRISIDCKVEILQLGVP